MTDKSFKYDIPEGLNLEKGYPWQTARQTLDWVPAHSRVLELGSATGYMGQYLKEKKGCEMVGVEMDPSAAGIARPHYSKIWTGDLNNLETLARIQGPFDVILCLAVLEHLNHPVEVLKNLKSLLTDRGIIVIALPNIAHWSIRISLLFGHFDYSDYGILDSSHLRFFTIQTSKDLVRNTGLFVEKISFDFDAGFRPLTALVRRLPKGWAMLNAFYKLMPAFFGYQILMKARKVENISD